MKVYAISLRRSPERRHYIETHLQSLGLDYQIVDAIDYQKMTTADFARLTDEQAVRANPYLTKGVQACALSHAKVSGLIAAAPDRLALVLEDDVALPVNIKEILSSLEKEIKEEEIISLSYYSHFHDGIELSTQDSTEITSNSKLFYPVNLSDVGSAMAYLLPRTVAAKLAAVMVPVRVAADYWGEHHRQGAFHSFRCFYPISVQPATFRSTLNYTAVQKSVFRRALAETAGYAAMIVRRTRFPFLLSYLENRDRKRTEQKYLLRFVPTAPFNAQPFSLGNS